MYSGNDSVQYPTQWALNPSAYQNMSNDQVDWAALAQQWIFMKETGPNEPMPVAPPPPPIVILPGTEGGEAPMEVEAGDVEAPPAPGVSQTHWNNSTTNPSWGNSWDQWGNWGWNQTTAPGAKPSGAEPPYSGYTTGESNFSGYNSSNQNYNPGYWSNDDAGSSHSRPEAGGRPPNSRANRRNRAPPVPQSSMAPPLSNQDTTQTIDAAKRKQLPAWIRQGLEKMEREKQKQLDKEREKQEREEFLRQKRLQEEQELEQQQQPGDGQPRMPAKSKFDSDSDESEGETKVDESRARREKEQKEPLPPPPVLQRSQEEVMQDIMLSVRRTLTEILLDVTTERILSICQQELDRSRSQASRGAPLASKSQALSAIGGQLGLGIYGDSSGESDSDSGSKSEEERRTPASRQQRSKSGDMSDKQLQESIRRLKSDFEKTSREIEARIAAEEEEEESSRRKHHQHQAAGVREGGSTPPRGITDGEATNSTNQPNNDQHRQKSYDKDLTPPPTEKITKERKPSTEKAERNGNKNKHGGNHDKTRSLQVNLDISRKSSKTENKESSKHKASTKRDKNVREKKKSAEEESQSGSSSSSDSSESSDTDSTEVKSLENKNKKRSRSETPLSSTSTSSSRSSSNSSNSSKKNKKKRSSSSDESEKTRKTKKEKRKGKKAKDKKSSRALKHVKEIKSDKFDIENVEGIRKKEYESRRESQVSSKNSYALTPERKSKYDRSRSRSADHKSSRRYDSYSKSYTSSRYRSRERRGRSRSRDRSRDDRDRRDRSREERDRRARSRERRTRKDSRSYRY